MKRKIKIMVAFILVLALVMATGKTYSRYILTRDFAANISSAPFYFDAIALTNEVVFPRTSNTSDREDILMTTTTFNLTIKNNNDTNYNIFATTYTVSIIDSPKFSFTDGNTVTKIINGGSLINDEITLNLKINDLSNPSKTLKLRVTSTAPYTKSKDITLKVVQEGAIQTIEDLLDLSLSVRGLTKANDNHERFKMTRDLDFKSASSYDDANRSDYGDANKDGITESTLIDEMTKAYSNEDAPGAGFLPIGIHDIEHGTGVETIHEFCGTFNGGNHSISNLRLHKAKQVNIGFFGQTNGAYIMNLKFVNGDVYNQNQTAAMAVGKAEGGVISNITIEGGKVTSVDTIHTTEDTYAAGVVGVLEGGEINNCTNRATVTTQFTGDTAQYSGPAGGIVAWMKDSTVKDCYNYGTVTGQKFTGGIAGFAAIQGDGLVQNCHNYGRVTTYITTGTGGPGQSIGGITGYNGGTGIVEGCTNHEEAYIQGRQNIGGIVGRNLGTVRNNYNYSKSIYGQANVGGIVGQDTSGGKVTNNHDSGSYTTTS